MIVYYSGTPGIRGGLPEELLDNPMNVMSSMVEYSSGGKDRIADRRLGKILEERSVDFLQWQNDANNY